LAINAHYRPAMDLKKMALGAMDNQ
jgi:hypothetical protein